MALKSIQTKDETYYCDDCKKECRFPDVCLKWRCPICNSRVRIKIKIDGNFQDCIRVNPNELKIRDYVTIENKGDHWIKNIEKEEHYFRVAIANHSAMNMNDEDFITKIDGAWYDRV